MRVIGAGFSRTGTTSLQAALDRLGYGPCLHGWDFAGHPALIRAWRDAYRNPDKTDWEALLGPYDVTLEFPMAALWRELASAFPAAKVIVSVRDENAWYDSMAGSVFRIPLWLHPAARRILRRVAIATSSWLPPYPGMYEEVVYEGVFGGRLDRDGAIEVYRKHTETVVRELPADRVLVWQPSDGWPPLCEFLGVPVPDEPFPRLNNLSSWQDDIRKWPLHLARQVRDATRTAVRRVRSRHTPPVAVVPPRGAGPAVPAVSDPSEDALELLVTER